MADISDILKKVRRLEIKSRRLTTNIFSGEYHSAFKGRGMSFKEVREYYAGDDVRFIDWNTSARFGHPFSKVFEEERELTVMLLIDVSASNSMGTRLRTKQELITEIAATIAYSAISNSDKVGAVMFTNKVEQFIPPAKGKEHLLYMLRKLLTLEPDAGGSNPNDAFRLMHRISRQKGIVFLLSDFEYSQFGKNMAALSARHDCIAIHVHDNIETHFPNLGLVPLQDAETGKILWADTNDPGFAHLWKRLTESHFIGTRAAVQQAGWDYITFSTDHDFVRPLQHFFLKRIHLPR
jgi:uncharacterized protein (DUF58 family)